MPIDMHLYVIITIINIHKLISHDRVKNLNNSNHKQVRAAALDFTFGLIVVRLVPLLRPN